MQGVESALESFLEDVLMAGKQQLMSVPRPWLN